MNYPSMPFSLMLIGAILFRLSSATTFSHAHGVKVLGHWRHAARSQLNPTQTTDITESTIAHCTGTGCVAVSLQGTKLACAADNGTVITVGVPPQDWVMLCDTDFLGQDIYPFILAGSFEECLDYCDKHNHDTHEDQCVGFVFAPDRINAENDCYLKSSTNDVISPSAVRLVGATLVPKVVARGTSLDKPAGLAIIGDGPSSVGNNASSLDKLRTKLLGTSTDKPTKQYVSHLPALPIKLASTLLQPGINMDLVNKYPLASNTGSWTKATTPFGSELANLTVTPRFSRDGGKGGNINGTHVFYFCDTSTFGEEEGPLGYMNGFVSSSAAVDVSKNALVGKALELQAPVGQWQDDVGRLRGWIPMTTGEEAFNIAVSGEGYRYAVWPESSFIPLNFTHSLIYAPIVYVEVDMHTQHAEFTSLGNTLVTVSVDDSYGPRADRIVKQLFKQDEVEWGSLGGMRAWTKTGYGTNNGSIYLFGQVEGGVLVAKVGARNITHRDAYTYWNGTAWSSEMPGRDSTAYVIQQPVMDMDMFYAPFCNCIIMVYLTPFADNTFYIRQLDSESAIIPPYKENGDDDYLEAILHGNWTEPKVLIKPEVPAEGYVYAGGCHLGYFGEEDVTNGGLKFLLTWTEHTPKDPNNPASGYAHKSIIVEA